MKPFTIVLLLLLLCIQPHLFNSTRRFNFHKSTTPNNFDPYATLSLHPTASPTQIQKAYRTKARETHPDKNPSPNANEEFRFISEAFDILSDPKKKRVYDEQRLREERMRAEQKRREERQRYAQEREREQALMRQREMIQKARSGYDKVLKWSKLSHLEEMAVDDQRNMYTTNVLIMFVGNKAAEKKGEEDYYFPYPFVGEWDSAVGNDVLLVAKVRYNSPTPLTRQFRVPSKSDNPYFIFAKKGDSFHHYHIYHPKRYYQTDTHQDWRHWVQSLLVVRGVVVNHHSLPVTIFILRNGRIEYIQEKLNPQFELELGFHPGDQILAFDSRLDNFPGGRRYTNEKIVRHAQSIAILDTVVTSETEYVVHNRRCYDLSTQCYEWSMTMHGRSSQCYQNPEFMHNICPKACGVCSDGLLSDWRYYMFHFPEHKMPSFVVGFLRGLRMLLRHVGGIVEVSRTSAAVFLVLGLLMAFNLVFLEAATKTSRDTMHGEKETAMTFWDYLLLVLALGVCYGLKVFVATPRHVLPVGLRSFHTDFTRVSGEPEIYIVLLIGGIIAHVYVRTVVTFLMKDDVNSADIAYFMAVMIGSVAAALYFVFFIRGKDTDSVIRWDQLFDYQKNAACTFMFLGSLTSMTLQPLKTLLKGVLMADNIAIMMIPNVFVIGGIKFLTAVDRSIHLDLLHTISKNKVAVFVLLLCGMMGGVLYMKLIDMIASGDEDPPKEKVD